ncbi:DNA excision repair protein ERCC-2 [Aequitasia blattaphilus]|uniref:ATP-dependent DNA helicase n=1 Tax=Aequitasia blattaphilus TaxID=2949332 RepID=A0ABT1E604_9FIRM|nr:ATP-dependent DNA helicase [Aequitasia blattaphilus]MCP1101273.1 ATP-dependent DNA helicase [Aequitasia blattaphilus]MCR8613913.1 ATP-dependent DNA helicase [Aequitasia blattaphilus]
MEKNHVRISVRNFVEFLLQEGDIDNRSGGMDLDAMQQGARLHRKIQQRMGSNYTSEVSLKKTYDLEGIFLQLEGRADGIIKDEEGVCIDEIKGVLADIHQMEKPVKVHLAQAMCYACIYAEDNQLKEIAVQMTYANLETEEVKRFRELFTSEYLREWLDELLAEYRKWASFSIEWGKIRTDSIKQVEFPYEYREGQKELVLSVYRSILRKKQLFIQAPTGVGKTLATLFPSVKAVGEGLGEKIFYLTAKTITRVVAHQGYEKLREKGLLFKTIILTAKDKICFMDETNCNPEYCPYAKGHYDRINDAVFDGITQRDVFDRETIEEHAKKWRVCPFELGLDISLWMDGIICDYNYAFDPNAHLKRFFADSVKGDYLFLIDEAHNLVERGRDMYSATIYKQDFLQAKKVLGNENERLKKALAAVNKKMLEMKKECDDFRVLESVPDLYFSLSKLMFEMERYFDENKSKKVEEDVLGLFFKVRSFLSVYENLDENYQIYEENGSSGEFKVCLFCVNPGANLSKYLDKGVSSIFFSATLLPVKYYKGLLSTREDDYAVYASSPFRGENRKILIGGDVSTKYTMRGPDTYKKYAQYILDTVQTQKGNYLVFFPSYQFLEDVYMEFLEVSKGEKIEYATQGPYMSEEAREIFLENFTEEREESFVGFTVMGGIFSEGIDLTKDKLIGAIIIGTGLPQIGRERELLKEYFDKKGENGFNYAYLYPGMNKVLQSAGRVIRTEKDRGIILLLDERFKRNEYRAIFPREWEKIELCTISNIKREICEFWFEIENNYTL